MPDDPRRGGWPFLRRWPAESPARAIAVTLLVCTVCSALIATAVNALRPYQERNRAEQRSQRVGQIIAAVPGLADVLGPLASARIEPRLIDLASGEAVPTEDPTAFDARQAARDPETSVALPPERDLAGIGRRASRATVFLVYEGRQLRLVVLPVYGAGYVSTLYGYLALDPDLNTIRGLSFYEQGETPGLGSEIDDPAWREQWSGKWLRDPNDDPTGTLRIQVARGPAPTAEPESRYQVDGITGATRTGNGVTRLLRFWLGPDGFGPFLERLRRDEEAT